MDDNTVSTKLVRYLLSQFRNLLLKQLCLTEMENLLANLPSPDANEASLQLDLQAMQFFNRTFIQLFTQQFSAYQQIKHDDNSLFFDSYKDGTSVIKLKGVPFVSFKSFKFLCQTISVSFYLLQFRQPNNLLKIVQLQ
uniref:Uncharacterized protein n=1 Tax=Oryza barthii TaxID=65489 RepID=A0A0D3FD56_9ORYZ